jgi:hypothetical protein
MLVRVVREGAALRTVLPRSRSKANKSVLCSVSDLRPEREDCQVTSPIPEIYGEYSPVSSVPKRETSRVEESLSMWL